MSQYDIPATLTYRDVHAWLPVALVRGAQYVVESQVDRVCALLQVLENLRLLVLLQLLVEEFIVL